SVNRHYLVTEDERPFFWLGDTAWELIHRLNLDGLNTPNAYGQLPLLNNDPTTPNEAYFDLVDTVIRRAAEEGLYIALLPTWGDKFNKAWGLGPEIFTVPNAEIYGAYLGQRYRDFSNLVWVIGGDRIPTEAHHYAIIMATIPEMAKRT